jgi:hypothetical protein
MPSGWDAYYVVFLSALLALCIPATLSFLSRILSQPTQSPAPLPTVNATPVGRRVNTRFFLGANVSLLLLALALVLIPCVAAIQSMDEEGGSGLGLITLSIISIAVFCSLGLLYASRKGDLDWLRSYRESSLEKPK